MNKRILEIIPDPKRLGYYWAPEIEKRFRKLKRNNETDKILEEDAAIARALSAAIDNALIVAHYINEGA